ncbi:fumarylacetoacetate hydrolase domain-containing protein 2A-like [Coccinella septempunctata]|uniref:fumarylacetoacetate hydrolase domain-containing protein 2A-like n=1 Tax=Coccinella septempunctata TaxID=41139 RepID=UPI001D0680C1|nr:fumarylacetoacetate hydrolase domain-containing protein 2A-like [Coccinella septempunctata]
MNSNLFCNSFIGCLIRNQLKSLNLVSSRKFSVSKGKPMRYVQFRYKTGGVQHLGAQIAPEGDIFDLSAVDSTIPNSLVKFLKGGSDVQQKAKRIIADGKSIVHLEDVVLLPPITNPDKVACVGLNYKGHCDEQNKPYPKEPMIFSKFSSVITGPYDNIELPKISQKVDWEVELAIIIGKKGKNLKPDQAQDVIFGFTVAQDISARDWQKRNNGQFLLGKTMDTFCPLGPAVVTKDKVDVNNLAIKCWVNGVLKQSGNTNDLVFKTDFLVSHLSQFVTLYPGDVILTGTPGGVGMYRNPPEYLTKGDVVESEIEGIGRLKNTCI